MQTTNSN